MTTKKIDNPDNLKFRESDPFALCPGCHTTNLVLESNTYSHLSTCSHCGKAVVQYRWKANKAKFTVTINDA